MKAIHLTILAGVLLLVSASIGFWFWTQDSRDQLGDEQIESIQEEEVGKSQVRRVKGVDVAPTPDADILEAPDHSLNQEPKESAPSTEPKNSEQGILVSLLFNPEERRSVQVYVGRTNRYHKIEETLSAESGTGNRVLFDDLTTGNYSVWVAGLKPKPLVPVSEGRVEKVEFDFRSVRWIPGIVVDTNAKPIANAQIMASHNQHRREGAGEVARSDSRGRFVLPLVGTTLYAIARKDGLAASRIVKFEWADDRENSLRLVMPSPSASLTGSLRFRGLPLKDARVLVLDGKAAQYKSAVHSAFSISKKSDAGGNFSIDGLKPGFAVIQIKHPSIADYWERFVLQPGRNEINCEFFAPCIVRGQVQVPDSSSSDISLRMNYVNVKRSDKSPPQFAVTDKDGKYEIRNISPGAVEILISGGKAHSTLARIEKTLGAGENFIWNPVLGEGDGIRGVVYCRESKLPIGNVTVLAYAHVADEAKGSNPKFIAARVDQDGRFVIRTLKNCAHRLLFIRSGSENRLKEFALDEFAAVIPNGNDLRVELPELSEASAHLKGHLIFGSTIPADVFVQIKGQSGQAGVFRQDVTDKKGRFDFGPIEADTYRVNAFSSHHGKIFLGKQTVSENQVLDLGDIKLQEPGHLNLKMQDIEVESLAADPWYFRVISESSIVAEGSIISLQVKAPPIPPGKYRVFVKRGKDGKMTSHPVVIQSGESLSITIPAE